MDFFTPIFWRRKTEASEAELIPSHLMGEEDAT